MARRNCGELGWISILPLIICVIFLSSLPPLYKGYSMPGPVLTAWSRYNLCPCQLMVVGTNSSPTGIPNLGCGEEGNFIQCRQLNCDTSMAVEQLRSDTTQLWSSIAARQPWGQAPLWLSSTLLRSTLPCAVCSGEMSFGFSRVNAIFSLWWSRKVHCPSQKGADEYTRSDN